MWRLIIASTWFQLLWFLAVLGQTAYQYWMLAAVALTYLVSWQALSVRGRWIGVIALLGCGVDWVNSQANVLIFPQASLPVWLVALWFIFAWYATFLVPVVSQYPLRFVSIVGGVAGSLSYWAGFKLGAVQFGFDTFWSLFLLWLEWAILVAIIIRVLSHEKNSLVQGRD
ncbi:DUF2878 domain-containing protein [Vibrio proteolyticus]|uniref:DUF2878 domain-containing protein n=1 Tax=Vibrio proteolyticus NBRC 13287 TaxID=1219065 RepID=U2ZYD6_VIBPR|nr:DUF2878 domain-containing protein [Vibrio proteolyticus]GAD66112.1 hypothetical protein VPR01S_03_00200 [Vibrio proteolyticus NBRC 13287]